MIRFLNLKNQICEDTPSFAFYDTVVGVIMVFGLDQEEVFDSKEQFCNRHSESSCGRPLERFLNLIPDNFFD